MSLILKNVWRSILRSPLNRSMTPRNFSTGISSELRPGSPDPVMHRLKAAGHACEVLATVHDHLPHMTQVHLLQALRSLLELQKSNKVSQDSLIKDPTFDILCQNIKKYARDLDVNEAIEATKVLCFLRVPATTLIVQSLLQVLRSNINLLNVKQIMFLDFVIGRFDDKSHLIEALKLALPLAFQIRLLLELDNEDLPLLKRIFSFCCYHDLPDRCINNVVTALLLHDQALDAQTAKAIIWSLCQINCTEEKFPTRVQLLHICYDILSMKMSSLTYDEVLKTAALIKRRVLEKHREFYHEELLDAVANYVVKNDVEFEKGLLVARVLSRIAHTHLGLVDHLCAQAVQTPTTLENARTNILFGLINCLANNNFTPEPDTWKEIQKQISRNPILDCSNITLPWIKLSLEMAVLGYYDDKVLTRVFSKDFLSAYLKDSNMLDYIQLLMLNEAVKTFHSDRYQLPTEVIDKAKALYPLKTCNAHVERYLAKGLGGPEYVAKNVVLPNGIISDLLVCIKGGYPVEFSMRSDSPKIPYDQLNIPYDTIVTCILNFDQGCFSMNSNRLRGTFRLLLDIIENQGYLPVAINVSEWLQAPDHERTPYLLRELGYKCGEIGMKLSVT